MNQKPKLVVFLSANLPAGSFHAALQLFLGSRRKRGISEYSVIHLFNSLWPLGDWLDNGPVTAVTPRLLKNYHEALFLRYAPGTVRPVVGDIRQFFAWCKKRRLIEQNPAKRLAKPRPRRGRDKSAPETAVSGVITHLAGKLSHLVYRDLFGTLQAEPPDKWGDVDRLTLRDLFVVVFLYETGGRAKELAQLGSRTIERECRAVKAAYVVTSTGKTNDRDLRFTEVTAELWRVWVAVRPSACPEYAVFSLRPTHPPAPLTSNGISQILARRCNEAGTAVFRSHSLRHAKVRRARRLVGLEMASLLIDHSSVEMTRNYAGVEDDEITTAVNETGIKGDIWGKKLPDPTV